MAYSGAHNDLLDAVGSHPRLRSLLSGVSAGEGSGGVIELRDASELDPSGKPLP